MRNICGKILLPSLVILYFGDVFYEYKSEIFLILDAVSVCFKLYCFSNKLDIVDLVFGIICGSYDLSTVFDGQKIIGLKMIFLGIKTIKKDIKVTGNLVFIQKAAEIRDQVIFIKDSLFTVNYYSETYVICNGFLLFSHMPFDIHGFFIVFFQGFIS